MPMNFHHYVLYDIQSVRLGLSVKSASQPAVFFSNKKPASSTFSQPDQPSEHADCISSVNLLLNFLSY
jgi:hypothetical protein